MNTKPPFEIPLGATLKQAQDHVPENYADMDEAVAHAVHALQNCSFDEFHLFLRDSQSVIALAREKDLETEEQVQASVFGGSRHFAEALAGYPIAFALAYLAQGYEDQGRQDIAVQLREIAAKEAGVEPEDIRDLTDH